MTVTDEDRVNSTHIISMTEAAFWQARQAAYAAGLERAAVIAEALAGMPALDGIKDQVSQSIKTAAAIRAEKDKTDE